MAGLTWGDLVFGSGSRGSMAARALEEVERRPMHTLLCSYISRGRPRGCGCMACPVARRACGAPALKRE